MVLQRSAVLEEKDLSFFTSLEQTWGTGRCARVVEGQRSGPQRGHEDTLSPVLVLILTHAD